MILLRIKTILTFLTKNILLLVLIFNYIWDYHLDEDVMHSNIQTIVNIESQIDQLLKLVNLNVKASKFSDGLNRDKTISGITNLDGEIKARLEVLSPAFLSFYLNGKWLGLCLSCIAASKVPGVDPGSVNTILNNLVERYQYNLKLDKCFVVSSEIKRDRKVIYDYINKLIMIGKVTNDDYQFILNIVLSIVDKFD